LFRAFLRARSKYVAKYYSGGNGKYEREDMENIYFLFFSLFVLQIGEHTWGVDIKTYLANFEENWRNKDFHTEVGGRRQVVYFCGEKLG